LNLALYNDWIENSQSTAYVAIGGSPQAFTVNVPRAMVSGAELDSSLRPATWLQVGAAVNYTDARFTDNLVDAGGSSQVYGTYPNTARWSGDVYSNFTVPITTGWDFVLHGDVYALSQTYFSSTANYNVAAYLPGYALVNFAIGLRDNEHHLSLNLNIKNALDKIYYVGGQPLAQLLQLNTLQPGVPRTILGTVRYDF
jgi:iron complex outermembrane receptor protein